MLEGCVPGLEGASEPEPGTEAESEEGGGQFMEDKHIGAPRAVLQKPKPCAHKKAG